MCAISFSPYDGRSSTSLANPANQGLENVPVLELPLPHLVPVLLASPSDQVASGDYYVQVRTNADQTNKGSTPATTATARADIGTLGPAANPHDRWAQSLRSAPGGGATRR